MDYQDTLNRIHIALKPIIGEGKAASYIPELANVAPDQFGMAVVNIDGTVFSVGDATKRFSTQSISKLFAPTLAFRREGDSLWTRVGLEPSGNPFNSLVQLEHERAADDPKSESPLIWHTHHMPLVAPALRDGRVDVGADGDVAMT